MTDYFAHSLENRPISQWQPLEEHLRNVAKLAAQFAEAFGGEEWAHLAGLWHDLGKYQEKFQKYLKAVSGEDSHTSEAKGKIDHSTPGAHYSVSTLGLPGHLLAYVLSGHHSGLLDGRGPHASLENRLKKEIEGWKDGLRHIQIENNISLPRFVVKAIQKRDAFSVSFFVRMLFSCLVDADFLDTEQFMNAERYALRPSWPPNIIEIMRAALNEHLSQFGIPQSHVDVQRSRVSLMCERKAVDHPGFFSLTVPTGGGKTLSSLRFALSHAMKNGLKRIVYVIPFTSIIEQNATVFRNVFASVSEKLGVDVVLEHHSNFDPDQETTRTRLVSENWDTPLVVTTSVQFYESLFANRTSRCRKLHNLSRSVIILDEVQQLPVDYLHPCLRALQELADHYGCSIVLCTATQPAVQFRDDFAPGLQGVRPIIDHPQTLYRDMKRVSVSDIGELSDKDLAERLLDQDQVLCIVNTRQHARDLFDRLCPETGHFHLSARMCPEHRSSALQEIRVRLQSNQTCRVISTQLIEAGVDIDFPVVYRSLAGVDSIAQAAGRCNRNGTREMGHTYVFQSEHKSRERYFAETADCGNQILKLYPDCLSLEAIDHYFRLYFWQQSARWDHYNILKRLNLVQDPSLPFQFEFATIAKEFRLIRERGKPLIIPWQEAGRTLVEELRKTPAEHCGRLLRRLQRFTIQIHEREWSQNLGISIELIHDQFPVLISPELHYSDKTGLVFEGQEDVFLSV